AAKDAAEREALYVEGKSRLFQRVFGLLCAFFAVVAISFFIFYRHKNRVAVRLAELNPALNNEQLKLQTSNQHLRRFSGVVSHDILANLDCILSAGNVLAKPEASKEHLVQYATITQQSSHQLKEYCLGLLREARGEHSSDQPLTDPMPIVKRV